MFAGRPKNDSYATAVQTSQLLSTFQRIRSDLVTRFVMFRSKIRIKFYIVLTSIEGAENGPFRKK